MTKRKVTIFIFLIVAITLIAFLPSLQNGFTNWDDEGLIVRNTSIRNISWNNIRHFFSSYYIGTYIPLTILSFSLEYHFFQLNPHVYHTTNLILHILNCLLVFWLIYMISGNIYVSLLTALLFGVHPLRVESVAWITERKDVLYSFFFLGALLAYLYYRKTENIKIYLVSLLLFILSVFSKGMAVVLSFVILLFDYYSRRKFDKKILIEKIPFLFITIVFTIIAILAQRYTEALRPEPLTKFPQTVFIATHSIIFYLVKTIVPLKLSALYPHPEMAGNLLPLSFLLSPVLVIGLIILVIGSRKYTNKIIFGSLFFMINTVMILGLLPLAGPAIAADRYIYIASIGLFFIFAEGVRWFYHRQSSYTRKLRPVLFIVIIGIICTCLFLTLQRCKIWKDSMTLWNDVLTKYSKVPDAYNGRGLAFYDNGEYAKALKDFNQVIKLNPRYVKAYYNRANAYDAAGDYVRAIADFTQALKLDPNYSKAYNNRGLAYGRIRTYTRAIADFTQAIRINPHYATAYNNRGLTYGRIGEHHRAIADFTQAINIDENYEKAYYNRAIAYFMIKHYEKAWQDVKKMQDSGFQVKPELIELLRKVTRNY